MNRLIVLSGVPGSGKSYFAQLLKAQKKQHLYIISSDEIRKQILGDQRDLSEDVLVFKLYYSFTEAYSKDINGTVILDATHAKKEFRLDKIKPYRKLYNQIDLICFKLDKDVVLKQNKEREFPIPEDALNRLIKEYTLPDEEEYAFYDHIDIITNHEINKIINRYL